MYTRFSQQDWAVVIDAATKELPKLPEIHSVPEPGSVQLARYIDHTLLKLEATEAQIDQLCQEALEHNFKVCAVVASLCPSFVAYSHPYMKIEGCLVP